MNYQGYFFHKDPEGDLLVVVRHGYGDKDWMRGFWSREETMSYHDDHDYNLVVVSHGVPFTHYDEDTDTLWIDKVPTREITDPEGIYAEDFTA